VTLMNSYLRNSVSVTEFADRFEDFSPTQMAMSASMPAAVSGCLRNSSPGLWGEMQQLSLNVAHGTDRRGEFLTHRLAIETCILDHLARSRQVPRIDQIQG
jgi:hypothetical protein